MLNKKYDAICYHKVRESQAAEIIRVGWNRGEHNKSDLLTKTTLNTGRRYDLMNSLFCNKCTVIEMDDEH